MNKAEVLEMLKDMDSLFGGVLKTTNQAEIERKINLYLEKLHKLEYRDVRDGLMIYLDSDSGKYIPSIKDIKDYAGIAKRRRESKEGKRTRRIMTAEEDIANEYVEIMEHAKKYGTSEEIKQELLKRKKYYLMFYGPDKDKNYEAYFGMPREEFEKLD